MQFITILKILLTTTGISAVIFLMLQVFFAQVITDTLLQATDDSILSIIIFLFFLVALVSALITTSLISQDNRIATAAVASFFITTILVITIAYCSVINTYSLLPTISASTVMATILQRGYQYLSIIPQILTVFAIYQVNPWIFFELILIIYNLIFGGLLGGIIN